MPAPTVTFTGIENAAILKRRMASDHSGFAFKDSGAARNNIGGRKWRHI